MGKLKKRKTLSFQVSAYIVSSISKHSSQVQRMFFFPTQILPRPASSFRVGCQFRLRCWGHPVILSQFHMDIWKGYLTNFEVKV